MIGQRKCDYPGQYAPELLDAVDELTLEGNPEYLRNAMEKHRGDPSLESVVILVAVVPDTSVDQALCPPAIVVDAVVEPAGPGNPEPAEERITNGHE